MTALDMFFQEREAPTFIKMDIEGAEKEALIGAEQIIRCHKPKLAICVYHKPEDIYVLPELINSFREDYRFYLDLRKYGSTRHAGFGLGFERCVMYLTGMQNIRDVVPFPRTVKNCEL